MKEQKDVKKQKSDKLPATKTTGKMDKVLKPKSPTKAKPESQLAAAPASPMPGTPRELPERTWEAIRKKAYELWEQRGCVPGHELEDWLKAKELVLQEAQRQ